MRFKK